MLISKKYWKTDLLNRFPKIANFLYLLVKGKMEIMPFNGIYTMLSLSERIFLYKLAKEYSKRGYILEVGCYAGGSTYFLAKGASVNNSRVFSIDPFRLSLKKQKFIGDDTYYLKSLKNKPSKKQVEDDLLKRGINKHNFRLIEGFSKEVARSWKKRNISLLWIDGNHLEAYKDFKNWKDKLMEGAVVAFHDSNYPKYGKKEVTKDVNKILNKKSSIFLKRVNSITAIKIINR